ncbi:MAG: glycosyltransferase family 2 protein [Candidatus Omnitrophica bacterium]|nr:glycosyltransferase family 2 protein [Candidatus Omnitrophota bacterium]
MEKLIHPKSLLSVCIAAYNDENTMERIIRESTQTLQELKLDFEIMAVNDCSSDNTGKILDSLQKTFKHLRVVNHQQNKGYGITIKELLYNSRGDIIFTLPGDLQIPPQEIKKMLPWINEYDIVIGARRPRNDPLSRKINSAIYNQMVNLLYCIGTSDVNSSKLIKRSVMDKIKLVSDGPFVDAELCAKAVRNNFKIKDIRIEHKQRLFGSPSGDKPAVMWKAFKETVSMLGKI